MSEEKIFDVAPGEKYVDDRSRLTVFFQVLGRKFWKLITINLMYLLFNLPAVIIALILGMYMVDLVLPAGMNPANAQVDPITLLFILTFPIVMFLMAIPVISVGPAQAGLTYLLRCFSYELPTFNWSDFKDKMKENLKQGLAVSAINLFIIVFLIVDFFLYSQLNNNTNFVLSIANGLLIVVLLIFLMMSMYLYPMMVSYDLKLKNLYKNAFLFAFAKFLPNLGILLLCAVLVIAPIFIVQLSGSVITLTILYTFYIILGFTLPGLIVNFYINPVIDRYINPASKEPAGEEEAKEISGETDK